jgi:hypothetical protein
MTTLTTLIPAYKKDYLGDVFASLSRQSFRDFRVVLSDDSQDAEISRLIRNGHYGKRTQGLHLTLVRGPGNARRNHEQLIDLWAGQTPLLHLLMDDDIIFPDFYRTHVDAHARGSYGATVTPRWLSQADGVPAWSLPLPEFITASDRRIVEVGAEQLFPSTVAVCQNWLGEFSNIVLSAAGARCFPRSPKGEMSYFGLMDIGTLLSIATQHPIAFVREPMGVFRQHAQQSTHQARSHGGRLAFIAWIAYALVAWREGRITPQQTVQAIGIATQRCIQHLKDDPVLGEMLALLEQHAADLTQFHAAFSRFWLGFLAGHPATCPAADVAAVTDQPAAAALVAA